MTKGEHKMFEQDLKDMTAIVVIEPVMYQTLIASNVGIPVDRIFCGGHKYDFQSAVDAINSIDHALRSCPKYLYKRIRAQRMSFVFAFGPDMESLVNSPPKPRS